MKKSELRALIKEIVRESLEMPWQRAEIDPIVAPGSPEAAQLELAPNPEVGEQVPLQRKNHLTHR